MDAETYSRSPSPEADGNRRADLFDDDDDDVERGGRRSPQGGNDSDRDSATGVHSEAEEEKDKSKKEKKKPTKPKGPVRRTMISEDMLTGKNGLTEVQDIFKDFKFLGKGKEKEDLGRILNTYEQWIHKLHPKYRFDECVERIEFLGLKKKPVKTVLKKIRMGLLSSADFNRPEIVEDDEHDEHLFPTEENIPMTSTGIDDDEFDAIFDEMESTSSAQAGAQSNSNIGEVADEDDGIPSMEEQMDLEREINSCLNDKDPDFPAAVSDEIDEPMNDDNEEEHVSPVPDPKKTSAGLSQNGNETTLRIENDGIDGIDSPYKTHESGD